METAVGLALVEPHSVLELHIGLLSVPVFAAPGLFIGLGVSPLTIMIIAVMYITFNRQVLQLCT